MATANPEKVESDSNHNPNPIPLNPESDNDTGYIQYNADDALAMLESGAALGSISPKKSARLLRRIDAWIMPSICTVSFLQYTDKVAVSYASVTGLRTVVHLVGDDDNWTASIFFFGQLFFEFPTIRLIQWFPLAKYISVNVVIWVPSSPSSQHARLSPASSSCAFSSASQKPLSCPPGSSHIPMVPEIQPSLPHRDLVFYEPLRADFRPLDYGRGNSVFLRLAGFAALGEVSDADEKAFYIEHLRGNQQGIRSRAFKKEQVWEALTNPYTWLHEFWVFAANVPNSIATSFGNIFVTGMGYSLAESLLLVTPLGAYEVVVLLGLTWLAMKTN